MFFAAIEFVPQSAAQEHKKPADKAELFRFLFEGLKTSRLQLRQGIFRAHGRRVLDNPTLGKIEGAVDIYCAFDFPAQKMRFDRTEPERVPRILKKEDMRKSKEEILKFAKEHPPGPPEARESGGKYIRTPKEMISQKNGPFFGDKGTKLDAPVDVSVPDKRPPEWAKPFDVRSLGLEKWSGFVGGRSNVEKMLDLIEKGAIGEVAEDHDGVYRIEWFYIPGSTSARQVFWVDAEHGATVVRMENQRRAKPPRAESWDEPFDRSEVTWKEIKNVWVPDTLVASNRPSPGILEEYDLSFAWESVNQPIDEVVFTVKGLEPKRGTYVVDARSGKPVTADIIGRRELVAEARERTRSAWSATRIAVVALTIVACAAAVLWIVKKRRKSRGAQRFTIFERL